MDVQEFYSLNPARLERYQPFLQERLKQKNEGISEVGWVNGLYVSRAIGGALPKGKRYPDSPIRLYGNPEEENEDTVPFNDVEYFKAIAMTFNKGHRNLKPVSEDSNNTDNAEEGAPVESADATIGGESHE